MKLVARICGVLSVLFLGVCILACATKSDQPAPREDAEKAPAKEDAQQTDKKKTSKPAVEKTEAKEKSE